MKWIYGLPFERWDWDALDIIFWLVSFSLCLLRTGVLTEREKEVCVYYTGIRYRTYSCWWRRFFLSQMFHVLFFSACIFGFAAVYEWKEGNIAFVEAFILFTSFILSVNALQILLIFVWSTRWSYLLCMVIVCTGFFFSDVSLSRWMPGSWPMWFRCQSEMGVSVILALTLEVVLILVVFLCGDKWMKGRMI